MQEEKRKKKPENPWSQHLDRWKGMHFFSQHLSETMDYSSTGVNCLTCSLISLSTAATKPARVSRETVFKRWLVLTEEVPHHLGWVYVCGALEKLLIGSVKAGYALRHQNIPSLMRMKTEVSLNQTGTINIHELRAGVRKWQGNELCKDRLQDRKGRERIKLKWIVMSAIWEINIYINKSKINCEPWSFFYKLPCLNWGGKKTKYNW